jgi:hypothetical protein
VLIEAVCGLQRLNESYYKKCENILIYVQNETRLHFARFDGSQ